MRRVFLPLLVLLAVLSAPAVASAVSITPVADGLRSPRHLDFAPWGDLYVAEAGFGGDSACFVGGEGPACSGPSGAVTRISRWGGQSRVVDGLGSYANDANMNGTTADDGDSGIGPHGLIADWSGVFFTSGGPTAPSRGGVVLTRDQLAAEDPSAASFGRLLWLPPFGGKPHRVADIYAFEAANNPDGNAVDTNATDVLIDRGKFVISDAGGNDVLRSSLGGALSVLSVFPNTPGVPNPHPFGPPFVDMQAVPTSVVEGPDGAYYMSQLTGFPFPVGGARVFRINPRTGAYSVFAGGFTNIMDLAFGRDGTLYVLEIDANGILDDPPFGAVTAISRKGKRKVIVPPTGKLVSPGGITVGPNGDLYVTNNARSPSEGQVLRIRR